ncbi:hypothetical protein AX15_000221 [Amanita polypyramis BW_CC]|nr:hypothetical protein AX15_000221 [Amanita polypyramis BW_CC]
MLSKVVSHLKRRFRKKDPRHSQPPALNRWSDFMNPFPHVEPGGYTRYYESHRFLTDIVASTSRSLTQSKQSTPSSSHGAQRRLEKKVVPRTVAPPIRIPDQPTMSAASETTSSSALSSQGVDYSPSSSTASSTPSHRPSKVALLAIPEESMASVATGKRRRSAIHVKNTSEISGASLRRRKRRMLRIPSMEHGCPSSPKPFSVTGSLSYTLSGASATSHGSCASSNTRLNSPAMTTTTLVSDVGCVIYKTIISESSGSHSEDDWTDRPDSQLSFRTARSDFDD